MDFERRGYSNYEQKYTETVNKREDIYLSIIPGSIA